jgi:hypothetical protein
MTVRTWNAVLSRSVSGAGHYQPRRVRAAGADYRCRTAGTWSGIGAADERTACKGERGSATTTEVRDRVRISGRKEPVSLAGV